MCGNMCSTIVTIYFVYLLISYATHLPYKLTLPILYNVDAILGFDSNKYT